MDWAEIAEEDKKFIPFTITVETQMEANYFAELIGATTNETDRFFGVYLKDLYSFLKMKSSVNMSERILKDLEIDV